LTSGHGDELESGREPVPGVSDYVWFGVQSLLFAGMLAAPVLQRGRVSRTVRVTGSMVMAGGVGVAAAGYAALGSSHSPWSTPVSDGGPITSGIYRRVRHPIYLGWFLGAVGGALLTGSRLGLLVAAALGFFYDSRARAEERLLAARYPTYAGYVRASRRFVPGLY
jgi:protein-S-isoprenylcysteine O-methyltransferase Ste14